MIAARTLWNTPLCVIDCGSAVTVDSIDANGQHLGGYIVPGLRMQRSLLQEETARVSIAEQARAPSGWGKETSECVSRGIEEALAGLVERSVRQLALELNAEVTTVITGGDGAVIIPLFECEAHYEEHLVLHGMARMVRERKD
jgi:type III pantothenate kinase